MSEQSYPVEFLIIINSKNEPLLFKIYNENSDDLNIQLHCYACLDFLQEKLSNNLVQYLGKVYSIYSLSGQYSIFAYYTVTKIKILAVFRQKHDKKPNEETIKNFFTKVYKLYKMQLYQPLQSFISQNRFSSKFHLQLDSLATATNFS